MSDDVSMQALSGSIGERTAAAIAAGCDLALHCNGDLAEMQAVAANAPTLTGRTAERAAAALAARRAPEPLDEAEARARFARLTAPASV
jgi:beta-N-acetylhexosaminidase